MINFFLELDEGDIVVLKRYGQGAYAENLKQLDLDIDGCVKRVNELCGIKESDTGLSQPALWDIAADKQIMQQEQPLQVNIFFKSNKLKSFLKIYLHSLFFFHFSFHV